MTAPVIITPAMRAADDKWRDGQRAGARQDREDTARWEREACERIRNRPPWWLPTEPGRST